jgi:arylformamidase
MKFIDLSHILKSGMPVYPGTDSPVISVVCTVSRDGFTERHISMVSHTGTHIDVPAHIFAKGKSISDYSAEAFTGKALKFSFSKPKEITVEQIQQRILLLGSPDFILFSNRWDTYWGLPAYFENFPLPQSDVFEYLCGLNLKGIGIDSISVDNVGSSNLPNHHLILSHQLVIIENLTRLHLLPDTLFDFYCFPLNIENGDGSPLRAIAGIN